jgi:hypothetical protein
MSWDLTKSEFSQESSVYAAPIETKTDPTFKIITTDKVFFSDTSDSSEKINNRAKKIMKLLEEYNKDLENLNKQYEERVKNILAE